MSEKANCNAPSPLPKDLQELQEQARRYYEEPDSSVQRHRPENPDQPFNNVDDFLASPYDLGHLTFEKWHKDIAARRCGRTLIVADDFVHNPYVSSFVMRLHSREDRRKRGVNLIDLGYEDSAAVFFHNNQCFLCATRCTSTRG